MDVTYVSCELLIYCSVKTEKKYSYGAGANNCLEKNEKKKMHAQTFFNYIGACVLVLIILREYSQLLKLNFPTLPNPNAIKAIVS